MTPLTKEQKKLVFDKLPVEIKEPMVAEETAVKVSEIAKTNGVRVESINKMAAVLGDIYLGLLTIEELPKALVETLGIEQSRAEAIKRDVSALFSPIAIPLMKLRQQAKIKAGGENIPATGAAATAVGKPSEHAPEEHPDHLLERGHILTMIESPHLHENAAPVNALAPKPAPGPQPASTAATAPAPRKTFPQSGQLPPIRQVQTLRSDIEAGKASGAFSNIVAQKMGGSTGMPKAEKVLEQRLPQQSGLDNKPAQDPYREPIN